MNLKICRNILSSITFSLLLFSCAHVNDPLADLKHTTLTHQSLYDDNAFLGYKDYSVVSQDQIFALNDQMKAFVATQLQTEKEPYQRAKKLLTHLFSQSPTSLQYQNGANLTAIETYNQNVANCLSLTILAYTLAEHAKLTLAFQEIIIPEYWVRNGQYNLLTGHVNLKVTGKKQAPGKVVWGQNSITIDFDPYSTKHHFTKRLISKNKVTAMFYNNRGAQAIVAGDSPKAYAYLKAATLMDPKFGPAWANLGLLYKQQNLLELAENTYIKAISLDNKNYNAWNNLSILYASQAKDEKAKAIDIYLLNARIHNPYYHGLLGDEALYQGNFSQAIKHFKRANKMKPEEDEFYFGLAKAYFKLGDLNKSQRYLMKAKAHAPFQSIEKKYQDKLSLFSSL
ncbi:tetratricopeptide repeat protein [Thalassotalea aquiviva]|uniref:tetratricopeptide repeat protein n=1 Tax=Thalassotalea aquiviva TaxID=3242415 RepID=UPI00352B4C2C